MSYRDFNDYIAKFKKYDNNLALTLRPFLKIERFSYRQLQDLSYQTAHYLSANGIYVNDRVMVIASNSPQWLVLFFATQLIGATLVPVDASGTLKTTERFISETDPKLIFKSRYLHPELNKQVASIMLEDLFELICNYPNEAPKIHIDGNNRALIVFTSGTTADPKGVVLTQNNILSNISGIQKKIEIGSNWRLLSVLPLSHMYELTGSLAVLSRGASIFYIPRVAPLAIARGLVDYQINTILAIPQLLILLHDRIQQSAAEEGKSKSLAVALFLAKWLPFKTRRLLFHSVHTRLGGHLNLAVTGGAPIPLDVAIFWEKMGVKMVQGYGLTETSPILTVNGLNERRLDSPGQPLNNVHLRISKDGEIQADGASVFSQYWQNPTATKEAFTSDGWFKTGDVGMLQDGWLHIKGRLKFAIVLSSGLKVFPEDIELAAEKHPVFKAFCVVGLIRSDGESVLAVIVSDETDKVVSQAIAEINNRLESFQHIDEWQRWPDSDFPRTRLLKIDRRQVERWANANQHDEALIKPDTASADQLIKIVNLCIGKPPAHINETDKLSDLGLDSLRRLNLVALIEGQLGITILEESVNKNTTISELRKLISRGSRAEVPKRRPNWPFWHGTRLIGNGIRDSLMRLIVRIWVKLRVEGRENLTDLNTPALYIFNHTDDFDGPVVYKAIPHRIRKKLAVAAAADVLEEHKILALITRFCFAGFSLARAEPFISSLEYVGQMIDKGWNVVLSPEGQISTSGKLQPFKSGIGLLAVNLGVPVVPIKTIGLNGTVPLHAKWPKRHSRVTVRIGQPISFNSQQNYDDVTNMLQTIMEKL